MASASARTGEEVWRRLRPFTGLIALALLTVIFGLRQPRFLSADNFFNVLNNWSIFGILAAGQAVALIGGGFDLSQGAITSLTGAVTASLLSRYGWPIPAALAAGVSLGAVLGSLNGVLVAKVGVNPFVATLGTQTAFFGLTNVYTNNQPFSLGPQADAVRQIAFGKLGPISFASLLFLGLLGLLAFSLRFLPGGQHLYVLGGNEEAARLSGLDTIRLKISTYAISGLAAAIGGIVAIARAGQASPVAGQGYELESLASCIVGGVALGGGVGGAGQVFVGCLTLSVVANGLQMAVNLPNWRPVIQGGIILLAVALDARTRARRG